jgi:hypothetical protein
MSGLKAQLRQGVAHLGGSAHGAQRIVLVRGRDAEDRHHGITDELLDRAAVGLDDSLHPVEIAGEHLAERLGVDRLA